MHVLYGVKSADTAAVATALGASLGRPFTERESSYFGDYWKATVGASTVKVMPQRDPEGELLEEDFKEHQVLVYVDGETDVEGMAGLVTPVGALERLRES